jgi:hypothetical protein
MPVHGELQIFEHFFGFRVALGAANNEDQHRWYQSICAPRWFESTASRVENVAI